MKHPRIHQVSKALIGHLEYDSKLNLITFSAIIEHVTFRRDIFEEYPLVDIGWLEELLNNLNVVTRKLFSITRGKKWEREYATGSLEDNLSLLVNLWEAAASAISEMVM